MTPRPRSMEGLTLLHFLMLPANAVCDALGVVDEHERGMIRMLVNMLLWTTLGAVVFLVAWVLVV